MRRRKKRMDRTTSGENEDLKEDGKNFEEEKGRGIFWKRRKNEKI